MRRRGWSDAAEIAEAARLRSADPEVWTFRALGRRYGVPGHVVYHALRSPTLERADLQRPEPLGPQRYGGRHADLTAAVFGDPPPGRSALDRLRAGGSA